MLLKKKNISRADIDKLVEERTKARAAKDFGKADEVRNKLVELGILVQDSAQGSEWEVAK